MRVRFGSWSTPVRLQQKKDLEEEDTGSNEKYIEFATQISNENKNYLLGVYKVIALNGTSIRLDTNNLL